MVKKIAIFGKKTVKAGKTLKLKAKVTATKKANKKIFGATGFKIPIVDARDELYYELKNIWYGKAV